MHPLHSSDCEPFPTTEHSAGQVRGVSMDSGQRSHQDLGLRECQWAHDCISMTWYIDPGSFDLQTCFSVNFCVSFVSIPQSSTLTSAVLRSIPASFISKPHDLLSFDPEHSSLDICDQTLRTSSTHTSSPYLHTTRSNTIFSYTALHLCHLCS